MSTVAEKGFGACLAAVEDDAFCGSGTAAQNHGAIAGLLIGKELHPEGKGDIH